MSLGNSLLKSRKLPAQYVETLWEHIYNDHLKMETLRSILTFYLQHRVYPPPVQKAFDALFIAFTSPQVSVKLQILLFQTVEEMCLWLSSSCILETVKLSESPSVVVGLLTPCVLVSSDTRALLPVPVYQRLLSYLTGAGLNQPERCKVLGFLMLTLPAELHRAFNTKLISWLTYSRTAQTTGSLFRSADVSEVDGSPSLGGICTALTLVNTATDLHVLSIVCFSQVRRYLLRSRECVDARLIDAVLLYCDTLLAQCAKRPKQELDKQLIAVVLEEVLLILSTIKDLDVSCRGRCLLKVGSIQCLADKLQLTSLLVSVWEYHLSEGDGSSLTPRMLGSIIKSEFSLGQLSQQFTSLLYTHGSKLTGELAQHAPNILKLVSTHPAALVEDFLTIVPHMAVNAEPGLVVEVLHSLLDLPSQSASICLHQTPLLVKAGIKVPTLFNTKQIVEAEHKRVYKHMMRAKSTSGETERLLKLYPGYWSAIKAVLSLGLVEVCCEVAPLLLTEFLDTVSASVEANRQVFPVLLTRVSTLCPVPSYQTAVFDVILEYVRKVYTTQPEVLEDPRVVQFLSVTSHTQLCPQLVQEVVTAVGDRVHKELVLVSLFENLEALLMELVQENNTDLKLQTSICTSLAKLACRHLSLIPRAITVYEKLVEIMEESPREEKEQLAVVAKDLIKLLKTPRVASVVLCPASKEDIAMAAILKVLFQFLD